MLMMKQVTRHSGEVILQIGTDRKIVYANPAFEKISGVKCKDVAGAEPVLTNLKGTPDEQIWKSLEKGSTWSGRLVLEGRGGKPVVLATMLLPFRNERGRIEGYLEIGRDITHEHLLDQRMRQSQKLEALGRLAGGIAHDFNNILSGIFGYAELTLIKEKNNPQVQKNMRKIIKATERASDLADQILTFSRRTEVEYRSMLPYVVVKEAVKLMRASIPSHIEIESKIDSRSAVMADPTQVHQIVMNLLTNAAQAIGDNSGRIRLELEDFLADEEFTELHPDVAAGEHVLLRVSDTGSGIEQGCLDRIFEPFFTTKPPGKGTGLGLSVVHGIVKKMGGALTVKSVVGQGSVFHVYIPVAEKEGLAEHESESILKGGKESVIVIDDEPAVAASIKAILSSLGFNAVAFTNSVEALEAIRKAPRQFDVIVSDYYMPKITGVEIAKNLRKAGVDVPMILISGFFGKKMENVGKGPGICECIAKPVNAYNLTEAIRRVAKRN
jgi:PAS domain S-box-containing protein